MVGGTSFIAVAEDDRMKSMRLISVEIPRATLV